MYHPKPKTYRNKDYLAYIRKQPCLICGSSIRKQPCLICGSSETIAHHVRKIEWGSGVGTKSHDYCTIPLCYKCHDREHRTGLLPQQTDIKSAIIDYLMQYIEEGI